MKIRQSIGKILCALLLVGSTSCQLGANKVEEECFAKVKVFANAEALHQYVLANGIEDVAACSDAIGDKSQSFLVVPGKEEVKLYIHRAVTDEYGNVEPADDAVLGYGEVGKPISFVCNFEGQKCPVVVEAVDGVGRRAYWSPSFDASGNLVTDSDFLPLLRNASSKEIEKIPIEQIGINCVLDHGKVYVQITDIQKFKTNYSWSSFHTPLDNQNYYLQGLSGKCQKIFVGDIGQNFNPVLCMLMDNGGVEILDIYSAVSFNDFMTSGLLEGIEDIVSFETGGGGEYEDEGEVRFSYMTIYAIDKNNQRHEIDYFADFGDCLYKDYSGDVLCFTPDWKLVCFIQEKGQSPMQYKGRFRAKYLDETGELALVKYHMTECSNPEEVGVSPKKVDLYGEFQLVSTDLNCRYITPYKGFGFGAPFGERVDFNRIQPL